MSSPILVYLHGMNSSPESGKAVSLIEYARKHHPEIVCNVPQQAVWPEKNANALLNRFRNDMEKQEMYIIGSSLGGYYATWLRESLLEISPKTLIKLVLINPAVRPYLLFRRYLGQQKNPYTGKSYTLGMKHVIQIKSLEVNKLTDRKDILVLLQTGDETLDYRQALEKYEGCNIEVEQGGNHAFENFEQHIPFVFSFLENRNRQNEQKSDKNHSRHFP